ncbi:MAG: PfkB family carbohydrate kinase, partial [Nocardioidaceae bacterium]
DDEFAVAGRAEGVELDVVDGASDVRRTLVIHGADGATTSLWEAGRPTTQGAQGRLVERVGQLLRSADALVISGSLPPGVSADLPADLAAAAGSAGVPAVADIDGEALVRAAHVPGVVLMPNEDELARLTGASWVGIADVVTGGADFVRGGARAVLATRGPDGIVGVTVDGAWHARLDQPLAGNPTGAGDAGAAAVARRLAASPQAHGSHDWPGTLAEAVAASSAAVLSEVAGDVDPQVYAELLPRVEVTEVARSVTS